MDSCAVLVPIKSFNLAKGRLANALTPDERSQLAQEMAKTVLQASQHLPAWVICDDPTVSEFALKNGANVIWRPSRGLNRAVTDGVEFLAGCGFSQVVIAHADLPLANDLTWIPKLSNDITIIPDRRGDGTNVMCIPTKANFRFFYGIGSAQAHKSEAERLGIPVQLVPDERLGWDVDTEDDLSVFESSQFSIASSLAQQDTPPQDSPRQDPQ